jgi:hypothetical protein
MKLAFIIISSIYVLKLLQYKLLSKIFLNFIISKAQKNLLVFGYLKMKLAENLAFLITSSYLVLKLLQYKLLSKIF